MKLSFESMKTEYASKIVRWRYEVPYDVYGYTDSEYEGAVEYMLKADSRFFAVLGDGELIGFRSFGSDGRVSGGVYDDDFLDTGGGLRPDLTGKGLGAEVIRKGLDFGARQFGIDHYRVTIAAFNERAIKVCRRLGFQEIQRFKRSQDGVEFVVLICLEHKTQR